MELNETSPVLENISVNEGSEIQLTFKVSILGDGEEIATAVNRILLKPGDDLTGQDKQVVALAEGLWTPEVLADYNQFNLYQQRFVESISINPDHEITAVVKTMILRNRELISTVTEEIVVKPGDDVAVLKDQSVQNAAKSLHSAEVVSQYQTKMGLKR